MTNKDLNLEVFKQHSFRIDRKLYNIKGAELLSKGVIQFRLKEGNQALVLGKDKGTLVAPNNTTYYLTIDNHGVAYTFCDEHFKGVPEESEIRSGISDVVGVQFVGFMRDAITQADQNDLGVKANYAAGIEYMDNAMKVRANAEKNPEVAKQFAGALREVLAQLKENEIEGM